MAPPSATVVHSWSELQERIAPIVERLNDDPNLALAAGANPFLALEELGYHVAPESRPEIEDRLRFPPAEAARRRRLRKRIFEAAGREFDLGSAEALHHVLFEVLSLRPYPDARGCIPPPPDAQPLRRPPGAGEEVRDPLEALRGKHPVVEPLLEYRHLDASRARLAPPAAYQAIRRGDRTHGLRNFRIRLKRPGAEPRRPTEPAAPGEATPTRPPAEGAGLLDLNAASAAELEALPAIGPGLARRIVAHREAYGPFDRLEALLEVPGIGSRALARLRAHVTIGG